MKAKAAKPTQPSKVAPVDPKSYYFQHWMEGEELIGDDGTLKDRIYTEPGIHTFAAYFREVPNNDWDVDKDVTNIPARGYFRVGEEAHFVITVKNVGNRELKNIRIEEQLKGASIVPGSGYDIENGVAVIRSLALKKEVKVEAVYVVTRNDLFNNRQFRNIVRSTAEFTEVEPGTPDKLTPVTADSGPVPAGAQGGGSGGSGGGGGSSTRSPGTGGGAAGGPGTVTIDPEAVPLANLPDMGNDDILALIDDEEVPLAALPKTGQAGSAALMLMISSMMLAAFAVVTRKKEEEQ